VLNFLSIQLDFEEQPIELRDRAQTHHPLSESFFTNNGSLRSPIIMPTLFDPIRVGELELPNRILMSPMTRLRATTDNIPTPLMVAYYAQRASAGLIIAEATPVSPMGIGYAQVAGIWSEEQTEAWKPITASVHARGGRIFQQLWHVGRISDPMFLHGELPVAPSAIAAAGHVSLVRPEKPFVTPRALETREVYSIVEQFRAAAQNAQRAGFDGVEIHGATGYLLDQFLQSGTNHRSDEFGGAIENRARLLLDVADACVSVWGAGRVGMRISPRGDRHDVSDMNPAETFSYVAREAGLRQLAYLHSREYHADGWLGPKLKLEFGGIYIANEYFTLETANEVLAKGEADAVAFGKLFIANPDLPRRFAESANLNQPEPSTFYSHGSEGYIDQPSLEAVADR
jgi:2,4-dienoyl-CoA reductase-like NADH-dependent reductase (Old Yellow Enzyme family)